MQGICQEVKALSPKYYSSFRTVYEDFCRCAFTEYKFELEPLDYDSFIESCENGLINCIIYTENDIPEAFLVYTLAISESIELNIVHSRNFENLARRSSEMIRFFMEQVKKERKEKVVCYPMLGKQKSIIGEISILGFKFVGIAVLKFLLHESTSRQILRIAQIGELPKHYTIKPWDDSYMNDAVHVVQNAFSTSADALFDTRFSSLDGTYDILNKIVTNVYADYLPEASSVLFYNNKPVGFCFANITGGKIVNIPIFAIAKDHQAKGLSKFLLARTLETIIKYSDENLYPITEINTNTETNNFQALKMYRNLGFKEDYNYPQSYLPVLR